MTDPSPPTLPPEIPPMDPVPPVPEIDPAGTPDEMPPQPGDNDGQVSVPGTQ
jgi:hypothetical protein